MELTQFEGQNRQELSMVEVAYAILEQKGDVLDFNALLEQIQAFLQLEDTELEKRMVRFYTDLNIDGRFISLGDNRWGLRAWYPIDSIDEEIISSAEMDEERPERRRKKRRYNAFAADDDMIDYNDDDPEDGDEIYSSFDEDEDEDEDDGTRGLTLIGDEDEDGDEELDEYASDLSEFGDVADLDEDSNFAEEDDEYQDEEDEEEDEEIYEEEVELDED